MPVAAGRPRRSGDPRRGAAPLRGDRRRARRRAAGASFPRRRSGGGLARQPRRRRRPDPRGRGRRRAVNVIFLEPGFPANQREFVRALRLGRRLRDRGGRPALRLARRRAEGLARRLPADRVGDRRGRARMGGAPLPGADVDRPARGGGRGARAAGGACARAVRHPGGVGADRLPLPRQGGDEGGAAAGGGADGGLGGDLERRRGARVRRGGGLSGDPEAARRGGGVGHLPGGDTGTSSPRRCARAGSGTARRSRSRSSSRGTRASTTR